MNFSRDNNSWINENFEIKESSTYNIINTIVQ